jgi:hypothetical protein
MFHLDLMPSLAVGDPEQTPGQRAFQGLLGAVEACLAAGVGRPHQDPNRLASLVWATAPEPGHEATGRKWIGRGRADLRDWLQRRLTVVTASFRTPR